MAPTVSVHLSRPCSGILFFVGASTHHCYSELYYYILCLISSLFKLLPPHAPPAHSLIYIGPILMNSMKKIIKTGKNQPLSTC